MDASQLVQVAYNLVRIVRILREQQQHAQISKPIRVNKNVEMAAQQWLQMHVQRMIRIVTYR